MGKRRKKKILIVEDEGLLATLIEEWLERWMGSQQLRLYIRRSISQ